MSVNADLSRAAATGFEGDALRVAAERKAVERDWTVIAIVDGKSVKFVVEACKSSPTARFARMLEAGVDVEDSNVKWAARCRDGDVVTITGNDITLREELERTL